MGKRPLRGKAGVGAALGMMRRSGGRRWIFRGPKRRPSVVRGMLDVLW